MERIYFNKLKRIFFWSWIESWQLIFRIKICKNHAKSWKQRRIVFGYIVTKYHFDYLLQSFFIFLTPTFRVPFPFQFSKFFKISSNKFLSVTPLKPYRINTNSVIFPPVGYRPKSTPTPQGHSLSKTPSSTYNGATTIGFTIATTHWRPRCSP